MHWTSLAAKGFWRFYLMWLRVLLLLQQAMCMQEESL
jgi:hypothetical protein